MASSIWSWLALAFAALLLPAGGAVLWLWRQRSGLRDQVAALVHDVENPDDATLVAAVVHVVKSVLVSMR